MSEQEDKQSTEKKTKHASKPPPVIDLVSSDDDDEKGRTTTRIATATGRSSSSSFTAKRPRTDDAAGVRDQQAAAVDEPVVSSPFKLFQTPHDADETSTDPTVRHRHCWSMRQMLGLDHPPGDDHQSMDTKTSMNWLCISNYEVSFDWLLTIMPELVSVPTVLAFYQRDHPLTSDDGGMTRRWRASDDVTLVRLDPSAEPRAREGGGDPYSPNPLRYRFRFGCHHTKMFLVGRGDGTLRVVIHTSNLLPQDQVKTQGAFVQDFPLKSRRQGESSSSQFEDDLVDYLTTYGHTRRHAWDDDPGKTATTLCEEIRRYDFRRARVVLVASTPGYYNLHSTAGGTAKADDRGHLKLARAIREHCRPETSSEPIVCQFSSLGALSVRYLTDFVTTLRGGVPCATLKDALKLVFPTPACIRHSVEGYAGGGTVPSSKRNVNKPFLRPLWHRWASSSSTDENPVARPRHVPHIKSYFQPQSGDTDDDAMRWFCLTSHNLSKAAWGECRTNARGTHLYVMHWELGVFTAPGLWSDDDDVVVTMGPVVAKHGIADRRAGDGASSRRRRRRRVEIPLPYDFDPIPYGPADEPFSWEETYPTAPDAYGRVGAGR